MRSKIVHDQFALPQIERKALRQFLASYENADRAYVMQQLHRLTGGRLSPVLDLLKSTIQPLARCRHTAARTARDRR